MPTISLYLDNRKTDPGEPAPLKLRLYVNRDNVRHFKTNLFITVDQFENSYHAKAPRGDNKTLKTTIEAIKVKADKIIENLGDNFTFETFERTLYKSNYNKNDIVSHFNNYIKELESNDQVGSADLYRLSLKSLLTFKGVVSLNFQTITVKFLNDYERWFINSGEKKKSLTSVGIYLRNLRFIFNQAIKAGHIPIEIYPFGKDKYIIPTGSNTKKAIENDVLKSLYEAVLEPGSSMKTARDFWFFSFQCNGMNFKDIASLRFKDLSNSSFSFKRQKTKRTIKAKNLPPILVPITEPIKAFILEYGNIDRDPDNYVFPIFHKGISEKDKMRVNRNFIRFVNDNMERLAASLTLDIKIGTMVARHSFTTKVTKTVGLEFAQEALGHTSLNTTQNYFAGFESQTKKDVADTLLDFD